MRNRVRMTVIGSVFIAAIAVAYTAGLHSRPEGTSAPVSRQSPDNYPAEADARADPDAVGASSNPENPFVQSPTSKKPAQDGEIEKEAPDDTKDGSAAHAGAGPFRPDPYVLKQQFPDNRAVPPATREEFMEKQNERKRREKLYGQIAANKASREEISQYYREQERLAEDSIEILHYILTEHADEMSETSLKKHEFLLDNFYKRLERIPGKEQAALDRLAKKKGRNG